LPLVDLGYCWPPEVSAREDETVIGQLHRVTLWLGANR
jgi:hypothetical protein